VTAQYGPRQSGLARPQVPFTEDQDAVGELRSGGEDEALGEAVRPRTAGGIFTVSISAPARTVLERGRLVGEVTAGLDRPTDPGVHAPRSRW